MTPNGVWDPKIQDKYNIYNNYLENKAVTSFKKTQLVAAWLQ